METQAKQKQEVMRVKESMRHKLDAKGNSVFISDYKDLFSNLRYSTIHMRHKGDDKQEYVGNYFPDNNYIYCAAELDTITSEYMLPLGVALFIGASAIHFVAEKNLISVNVHEIISVPTTHVIDATFVKRITPKQLQNFHRILL